jgi:predicted ArsR family transcriptional regulator
MTILKRHGQASTETLATEAFLSIGATRQHMQALVDQGLVSFDLERRGPGRPRHLFSLTPAGQTLFPQFYEEIADSLLAAVEAEDNEVRDRVFTRVAQAQMRRTLARLEGVDPSTRFKAAISALDDNGYFPSVAMEGKYARVSFLHCPLMGVAPQHPGVCEAEERCMRAAFGVEGIERAAHRINGDSVCTYLVPVEN